MQVRGDEPVSTRPFGIRLETHLLQRGELVQNPVVTLQGLRGQELRLLGRQPQAVYFVERQFPLFSVRDVCFASALLVRFMCFCCGGHVVHQDVDSTGQCCCTCFLHVHWQSLFRRHVASVHDSERPKRLLKGGRRLGGFGFLEPLVESQGAPQCR